MIGSDLFKENNNGISGDLFDGIVDFLDTPMEGVGEDIAGRDLDAELQSPPDDLAGLSSIFSGDICNGTPRPSANVSISYDETSRLKRRPNIVEDTSSRSISLHNDSSNNKRSHPLAATKPFYESGDSLETHLPKGILNSVKGKQKKRKKLSLLTDAIEMKKSSLQQPVEGRKCMHCEVTTSPEWRKGPMGLQTLCNACGHRYKLGRLFPEYRPAASPTFVPYLHSNYHNKVKEMRNRAGLEAATMASPTFVAPLHSNSPSHPFAIRKCLHCKVRRTPQWREGPMGPHTLCNACGLLYSRFYLFPEYRPAASPTFVPSLHSNSLNEIIEMRKKTGHEGAVVASPTSVTSLHSNSRKKVIEISNKAGQEAAMVASPASVSSLHSNSRKKVVEMSNKAGLEAAMVANPASVTSIHSNSRKKVVEMSNKAGLEAAMVASPTSVTSSHSNSHRKVVEMSNKAGLEAAMVASPASVTSLHSNSRRKVIEMSNKAGQEAAMVASPASVSSLHSNSRKKVVKMSDEAGQEAAKVASPASVTSLHSNSRKKDIEMSNKAGQEGAMVASPASVTSLHSNSDDKYSMQQPVAIRKCLHCEVTRSSLWRGGPKGPKTLCNACGIRYRSGRLFPDYRPVASPTFVASLHSNYHKKVIEMRNKA